MRKTISTRISDFEQLVTTENIYVDKTSYIYELVKQKGADYYFLSRPRRYGKSLMCSTLEYLFKGRRDLFEDLYIAKHTDYTFEKYPVLHFNFAKLRTQTFDQFYKFFQEMVFLKIKDNGGSVPVDDPPSVMLDKYLSTSEKEVVIIIDEFDVPVIGALNDIDKLDRVREELSSFYSVIKNTGEKVRFFFITGVTKLSNMSIFSKMNNLMDISMSPEYAAAFGYTEEELEENFSEYIDDYLRTKECPYDSKTEFLSDLRDYYDGYRFSPDTDLSVYNPISVGMFFSRGCKFRNYWDQTGISTLAVELARKYDLLNLVENTPVVGLSAFTAFDISMLTEKKLNRSSIYALLYYTGYLTILEGDTDGLVLAFPNKEISSSFSSSLVSRYMDDKEDLGSMIYIMKKMLERSDLKGFMDNLQQYYESFSYDLLDKDKEKSYQMLFHALFVASGAMTYAEDHNLRGRADNVLIVKGHIYIFELKVDGSVGTAINQIKTKKYYAKYIPQKNKGAKIHLVGINFSSHDRMIESYGEEVL